MSSFEYHYMTQVYFLKPVGQIGPIKIGASKNPLIRLNAFRTWSPVRLELVAQSSALRTVESWLHRHFLDGWLHGEWFAWSEELQCLVDYIATNGTLPEWVSPPSTSKEWRDYHALHPKGKPKMTVPPLFQSGGECNPEREQAA